MHLVNAGRICIPMKWKLKEAPKIWMWLGKVEEIMKTERITSIIYEKKRKIFGLARKNGKLWKSSGNGGGV